MKSMKLFRKWIYTITICFLCLFLTQHVNAQASNALHFDGTNDYQVEMSQLLRGIYQYQLIDKTGKLLMADKLLKN